MKRLTEINVTFRRGNSSSAISAGSRRTNLPRAINPKAYVVAFTSSSSGEGGGSVWKSRRLACIVVRPYTGSSLVVRRFRMALVPSNTWDESQYQHSVLATLAYIYFIAIANSQQHREDFTLLALDIGRLALQHFPDHDESVHDLFFVLFTLVSVPAKTESRTELRTLLASMKVIRALKILSKMLLFSQTSVCKGTKDDVDKGVGLPGCLSWGLSGGDVTSTTLFSAQKRARRFNVSTVPFSAPNSDICCSNS